jgi:hypothetical protein
VGGVPARRASFFLAWLTFGTPDVRSMPVRQLERRRRTPKAACSRGILLISIRGAIS